MGQNKVILIGGDHYNGLALVRLFGKQGLKPYGIIVGQRADIGFLKASRYWKKSWTVKDDSEILTVLRENFAGESETPVIIPYSDGAAATIDNNLKELKDAFIVPSINGLQSRIYEMMDKGKQVSFAEQCGLQMAKSYEINLDDRNSVKEIEYPCIGKPVVSCEGDKTDIKRIDSQVELEQYLIYLREKGYEKILLQKYVQIDAEYDIEGFIHQNDSTYFVSEKVRTWPNIGGPTSYSFSIDNPTLNREIDKIVDYLRDIGYSGLFDVEIFRVGKEYLFNEINWRNSAVCFAASASDVYYPWYWYCAVTNQTYAIRNPDDYGVRAMNELLDFRHVKAKDVGLFRWVKQLWQSEAYAYCDMTDMAPLCKRIWMSVKSFFLRIKNERRNSCQGD